MSYHTGFQPQPTLARRTLLTNDGRRHRGGVAGRL
jgi:hypothetical protein